MKIGKVSQTVLKRSILKPLQFHREESIINPAIEEMCYGISVGAGEEVLSASAVLYGDEKDLGVFALAQVVNDLATRGAKAVGASVHIMLPPYAYESRLKTMVEYVERAGSAHAIQIVCAKAEVSPVIQKAVVYVNGMGILKKGELLQSSMGKADQDIVLLKWIGLEGTFRIMREKEEELAKRFVPTFLNQIRSLEAQIFSEEELQLAKEFGVSAMHQITSGGILAALWEMSEASNVGIEVDLKKMLIKQETVEVCEFCHLNPYQLTSVGSVLIFTDRGEELVSKYEERGVRACVLGKTTTDTARVILGGEEKRFLDRPAADELLKIYENH
jgi:hydrogenase maturation factor